MEDKEEEKFNVDNENNVINIILEFTCYCTAPSIWTILSLSLISFYYFSYYCYHLYCCHILIIEDIIIIITMRDVEWHKGNKEAIAEFFLR